MARLCIYNPFNETFIRFNAAPDTLFNENGANMSEVDFTPDGNTAFILSFHGLYKFDVTTAGVPPNVYHWDGTRKRDTLTFIRNSAARHVFSLNSCSGCHGGETQTNFTHVDPVFFGKEATFSFRQGRPGWCN